MKKGFLHGKQHRHRNSSHENIIAIVVIVVLLLIIANMFAYWLYQKSQDARQSVRGEQVTRTQTMPIKEKKELVVTPQTVLESVTSLVSLDPLPDGASPVVAEIVNRDGLAEEDEIFTEAQNGDYVVLNGSQLVFYRPSESRIVLFQRIDPSRFAKEQPLEETVTSTEEIIEILPATIELRTGALSEELTSEVGDVLKKLDWVVSLEVAASEDDDFTETYIVDQTNDANPGARQELEKRFGGNTVTKVPEGERPSGADFLIIFGP